MSSTDSPVAWGAATRRPADHWLRTKNRKPVVRRCAPACSSSGCSSARGMGTHFSRSDLRLDDLARPQQAHLAGEQRDQEGHQPQTGDADHGEDAVVGRQAAEGELGNRARDLMEASGAVGRCRQTPAISGENAGAWSASVDPLEPGRRELGVQVEYRFDRLSIWRRIPDVAAPCFETCCCTWRGDGRSSHSVRKSGAADGLTVLNRRSTI
jgi:hypothetical protein